MIFARPKGAFCHCERGPKPQGLRWQVREVLRTPAVRLAQDSRLGPGETRFWLVRRGMRRCQSWVRGMT